MDDEWQKGNDPSASCAILKIFIRVFTIYWALILDFIMFMVCDVNRSMNIEPVIRLVFYVQILIPLSSTLVTIYEFQLFRNGPLINPKKLILPFLIDMILMILVGCTSTIATVDLALYGRKYRNPAHICKYGTQDSDNLWLSSAYHIGNCYLLFACYVLITLLGIARWWPSRSFTIPNYRGGGDPIHDMEYAPYPNLCF